MSQYNDRPTTPAMSIMSGESYYPFAPQVSPSQTVRSLTSQLDNLPMGMYIPYNPVMLVNNDSCNQLPNTQVPIFSTNNGSTRYLPSPQQQLLQQQSTNNPQHFPQSNQYQQSSSQDHRHIQPTNHTNPPQQFSPQPNELSSHLSELSSSITLIHPEGSTNGSLQRSKVDVDTEFDAVLLFAGDTTSQCHHKNNTAQNNNNPEVNNDLDLDSSRSQTIPDNTDSFSTEGPLKFDELNMAYSGNKDNNNNNNNNSNSNLKKTSTTSLLPDDHLHLSAPLIHQHKSSIDVGIQPHLQQHSTDIIKDCINDQQKQQKSLQPRNGLNHLPQRPFSQCSSQTPDNSPLLATSSPQYNQQQQLNGLNLGTNSTNFGNLPSYNSFGLNKSQILQNNHYRNQHNHNNTKQAHNYNNNNNNGLLLNTNTHEHFTSEPASPNFDLDYDDNDPIRPIPLSVPLGTHGVIANGYLNHHSNNNNHNNNDNNHDGGGATSPIQYPNNNNYYTNDGLWTPAPSVNTVNLSLQDLPVKLYSTRAQRVQQNHNSTALGSSEPPTTTKSSSHNPNNNNNNNSSSIYNPSTVVSQYNQLLAQSSLYGPGFISSSIVSPGTLVFPPTFPLLPTTITANSSTNTTNSNHNQTNIMSNSVGYDDVPITVTSPALSSSCTATMTIQNPPPPPPSLASPLSPASNYVNLAYLANITNNNQQNNNIVDLSTSNNNALNIITTTATPSVLSSYRYNPLPNAPPPSVISSYRYTPLPNAPPPSMISQYRYNDPVSVTAGQMAGYIAPPASIASTTYRYNNGNHHENAVIIPTDGGYGSGGIISFKDHKGNNVSIIPLGNLSINQQNSGSNNNNNNNNTNIDNLLSTGGKLNLNNIQFNMASSQPQFYINQSLLSSSQNKEHNQEILCSPAMSMVSGIGIAHPPAPPPSLISGMASPALTNMTVGLVYPPAPPPSLIGASSVMSVGGGTNGLVYPPAPPPSLLSNQTLVYSPVPPPSSIFSASVTDGLAYPPAPPPSLLGGSVVSGSVFGGHISPPAPPPSLVNGSVILGNGGALIYPPAPPPSLIGGSVFGGSVVSTNTFYIPHADPPPSLATTANSNHNIPLHSDVHNDTNGLVQPSGMIYFAPHLVSSVLTPSYTFDKVNKNTIPPLTFQIPHYTTHDQYKNKTNKESPMSPSPSSPLPIHPQSPFSPAQLPVGSPNTVSTTQNIGNLPATGLDPDLDDTPSTPTNHHHKENSSSGLVLSRFPAPRQSGGGNGGGTKSGLNLKFIPQMGIKKHDLGSSSSFVQFVGSDKATANNNIDNIDGNTDDAIDNHNNNNNNNNKKGAFKPDFDRSISLNLITDKASLFDPQQNPSPRSPQLYDDYGFDDDTSFQKAILTTPSLGHPSLLMKGNPILTPFTHVSFSIPPHLLQQQQQQQYQGGRLEIRPNTLNISNNGITLASSLPQSSSQPTTISHNKHNSVQLGQMLMNNFEPALSTTSSVFSTTQPNIPPPPPSLASMVSVGTTTNGYPRIVAPPPSVASLAYYPHIVAPPPSLASVVGYRYQPASNSQTGGHITQVNAQIGQWGGQNVLIFTDFQDNTSVKSSGSNYYDITAAPMNTPQSSVSLIPNRQLQQDFIDLNWVQDGINQQQYLHSQYQLNNNNKDGKLIINLEAMGSDNGHVSNENTPRNNNDKNTFFNLDFTSTNNSTPAIQSKIVILPLVNDFDLSQPYYYNNGSTSANTTGKMVPALSPDDVPIDFLNRNGIGGRSVGTVIGHPSQLNIDQNQNNHSNNNMKGKMTSSKSHLPRSMRSSLPDIQLTSPSNRLFDNNNNNGDDIDEAVIGHEHDNEYIDNNKQNRKKHHPMFGKHIPTASSSSIVGSSSITNADGTVASKQQQQQEQQQPQQQHRRKFSQQTISGHNTPVISPTDSSPFCSPPMSSADLYSEGESDSDNEGNNAVTMNNQIKANLAQLNNNLKPRFSLQPQSQLDTNSSLPAVIDSFSQPLSQVSEGSSSQKSGNDDDNKDDDGQGSQGHSSKASSKRIRFQMPNNSGPMLQNSSDEDLNGQVGNNNANNNIPIPLLNQNESTDGGSIADIYPLGEIDSAGVATTNNTAATEPPHKNNHNNSNNNNNNNQLDKTTSPPSQSPLSHNDSGLIGNISSPPSPSPHITHPPVMPNSILKRFSQPSATYTRPTQAQRGSTGKINMPMKLFNNTNRPTKGELDPNNNGGNTDLFSSSNITTGGAPRLFELSSHTPTNITPTLSAQNGDLNGLRLQQLGNHSVSNVENNNIQSISNSAAVSQKDQLQRFYLIQPENNQMLSNGSIHSAATTPLYTINVPHSSSVQSNGVVGVTSTMTTPTATTRQIGDDNNNLNYNDNNIIINNNNNTHNNNTEENNYISRLVAASYHLDAMSGVFYTNNGINQGDYNNTQMQNSTKSVSKGTNNQFEIMSLTLDTIQPVDYKPGPYSACSINSQNDQMISASGGIISLFPTNNNVNNAVQVNSPMVNNQVITLSLPPPPPPSLAGTSSSAMSHINYHNNHITVPTSNGILIGVGNITNGQSGYLDNSITDNNSTLIPPTSSYMIGNNILKDQNVQFHIPKELQREHTRPITMTIALEPDLSKALSLSQQHPRPTLPSNNNNASNTNPSDYNNQLNFLNQTSPRSLTSHTPRPPKNYPFSSGVGGGDGSGSSSSSLPLNLTSPYLLPNAYPSSSFLPHNPLIQSLNGSTQNGGVIIGLGNIGNPANLPNGFGGQMVNNPNNGPQQFTLLHQPHLLNARSSSSFSSANGQYISSPPPSVMSGNANNKMGEIGVNKIGENTSNNNNIPVQLQLLNQPLSSQHPQQLQTTQQLMTLNQPGGYNGYINLSTPTSPQMLNNPSLSSSLKKQKPLGHPNYVRSRHYSQQNIIINPHNRHGMFQGSLIEHNNGIDHKKGNAGGMSNHNLSSSSSSVLQQNNEFPYFLTPQKLPAHTMRQKRGYGSTVTTVPPQERDIDSGSQTNSNSRDGENLHIITQSPSPSNTNGLQNSNSNTSSIKDGKNNLPNASFNLFPQPSHLRKASQSSQSMLPFEVLHGKDNDDDADGINKITTGNAPWRIVTNHSNAKSNSNNIYDTDGYDDNTDNLDSGIDVTLIGQPTRNLVNPMNNQTLSSLTQHKATNIHNGLVGTNNYQQQQQSLQRFGGNNNNTTNNNSNNNLTKQPLSQHTSTGSGSSTNNDIPITITGNYITTVRPSNPGHYSLRAKSAYPDLVDIDTLSTTMSTALDLPILANIPDFISVFDATSPSSASYTQQQHLSYQNNNQSAQPQGANNGQYFTFGNVGNTGANNVAVPTGGQYFTFYANPPVNQQNQSNQVHQSREESYQQESPSNQQFQQCTVVIESINTNSVVVPNGINELTQNRIKRSSVISTRTNGSLNNESSFPPAPPPSVLSGANSMMSSGYYYTLPPPPPPSMVSIVNDKVTNNPPVVQQDHILMHNFNQANDVQSLNEQRSSSFSFPRNQQGPHHPHKTGDFSDLSEENSEETSYDTHETSYEYNMCLNDDDGGDANGDDGEEEDMLRQTAVVTPLPRGLEGSMGPNGRKKLNQKDKKQDDNNGNIPLNDLDLLDANSIDGDGLRQTDGMLPLSNWGNKPSKDHPKGKHRHHHHQHRESNVPSAIKNKYKDCSGNDSFNTSGVSTLRPVVVSGAIVPSNGSNVAANMSGGPLFNNHNNTNTHINNSITNDSIVPPSTISLPSHSRPTSPATPANTIASPDLRGIAFLTVGNGNSTNNNRIQPVIRDYSNNPQYLNNNNMNNIEVRGTFVNNIGDDRSSVGGIMNNNVTFIHNTVPDFNNFSSFSSFYQNNRTKSKTSSFSSFYPLTQPNTNSSSQHTIGGLLLMNGLPTVGGARGSSACSFGSGNSFNSKQTTILNTINDHHQPPENYPSLITRPPNHQYPSQLDQLRVDLQDDLSNLGPNTTDNLKNNPNLCPTIPFYTMEQFFIPTHLLQRDGSIRSTSVGYNNSGSISGGFKGNVGSGTVSLYNLNLHSNNGLMSSMDSFDHFNNNSNKLTNRKNSPTHVLNDNIIKPINITSGDSTPSLTPGVTRQVSLQSNNDLFTIQSGLLSRPNSIVSASGSVTNGSSDVFSASVDNDARQSNVPAPKTTNDKNNQPQIDLYGTNGCYLGDGFIVFNNIPPSSTLSQSSSFNNNINNQPQIPRPTSSSGSIFDIVNNPRGPANSVVSVQINPQHLQLFNAYNNNGNANSSTNPQQQGYMVNISQQNIGVLTPITKNNGIGSTGGFLIIPESLLYPTQNQSNQSSHQSSSGLSMNNNSRQMNDVQSVDVQQTQPFVLVKFDYANPTEDLTQREKKQLRDQHRLQQKSNQSRSTQQSSRTGSGCQSRDNIQIDELTELNEIQINPLLPPSQQVSPLPTPPHQPRTPSNNTQVSSPSDNNTNINQGNNTITTQQKPGFRQGMRSLLNRTRDFFSPTITPSTQGNGSIAGSNSSSVCKDQSNADGPLSPANHPTKAPSSSVISNPNSAATTPSNSSQMGTNNGFNINTPTNNNNNNNTDNHSNQPEQQNQSHTKSFTKAERPGVINLVQQNQPRSHSSNNTPESTTVSLDRNAITKAQQQQQLHQQYYPNQTPLVQSYNPISHKNKQHSHEGLVNINMKNGDIDENHDDIEDDLLPDVIQLDRHIPQ